MSKEKIYKYRKYIDTKKITIEVSENFRYLLCVPYIHINNDKSILVIMKNPSKADENISDHTINNVLKFCENKYSKVYIMNLFPNYSTDPKEVKTFINSARFQEVMNKNNEFLNSLLEIVDDVIIAWGGNSIGNKCEYDKAIYSVLNNVKKVNKKAYAVRIKGSKVSRKYPWHAQVWAVNHDLETYEWNIK
ncbi:DUF1643 domain-containing protein [Clostridium algidicarnis]|uniref:DUF1643 domain-containing protein n=2 Tax=Clostridium algidicarnis TaxID=37659 RepID=A0A2S6FUP0_9CLOT|nr:DUF1643 domain-containing protein [Clostridium algidicarnis]MBU3194937.1 DUF1643 domain-containing protein [Clostridium algidicarnis]MBU3220935.1 DUF1643 domain-containing protein [Clostridium algidicarnis]PPK44148.1 hypothetical protein BD821_12415 [Clostridium algidicarnis DSM 15099]